jgi:hypothetical protein
MLFSLTLDGKTQLEANFFWRCSERFCILGAKFKFRIVDFRHLGLVSKILKQSR